MILIWKYKVYLPKNSKNHNYKKFIIKEKNGKEHTWRITLFIVNSVYTYYDWS